MDGEGRGVEGEGGRGDKGREGKLWFASCPRQALSLHSLESVGGCGEGSSEA